MKHSALKWIYIPILVDYDHFYDHSDILLSLKWHYCTTHLSLGIKLWCSEKSKEVTNKNSENWWKNEKSIRKQEKSVLFEIPYVNSVWCQKSVFVRINPYVWQHCFSDWNKKQFLLVVHGNLVSTLNPFPSTPPALIHPSRIRSTDISAPTQLQCRLWRICSCVNTVGTVVTVKQHYSKCKLFIAPFQINISL